MKLIVAFAALLVAVSAADFAPQRVGFLAPSGVRTGSRSANDPPLPSLPTHYAIDFEVKDAASGMSGNILLAGDHEEGKVLANFDDQLIFLDRYDEELGYAVIDRCLRQPLDGPAPEPWVMPEEAVFMGHSHCALPTSGKRSNCAVWNLNDGTVDGYFFFHLHIPVAFEMYDAETAEYLGYQRTVGFTMEPEADLFNVPDICIAPPAEETMASSFSYEIDVYLVPDGETEYQHTYAAVNSVSDSRQQYVSDALFLVEEEEDWHSVWHMVDRPNTLTYDWIQEHDCAVVEYAEALPTLFRFASGSAFEHFTECPDTTVTSTCEVWKADGDIIERTVWDPVFNAPVSKTRVHADGTPIIRWEFAAVTLGEPNPAVFDLIDECLE